MSKSVVLDSPSAGIGSWRRSAAARGLRSRAARRVLLVLLLGALLAALLALLLRPFWNPDVHLHTLRPADASGPSVSGFPAPPAPDYFQNDLPDLQGLGEELSRFQSNRHPAALTGPRTPADWPRLGRQIETIAPGGGHIVLLYAAGHGLVGEGAAWLTWNYGSLGSETQRVRMDDLLRQLRASPARTKLLLLDAGRREYDPAGGAIVNDFTRLLAQDVLATGDESLWVLVSHSVGQRSHVSHLLRRSLFGYFVARGLRGEADLDGDRRIDLAELHGYVSAQIGHWLRQNAGDDARQTPVLLWGGGTSTDHVGRTVLLPVAPPAPAPASEGQAASEGESPADGDEAAPEAELFPESVIVQAAPRTPPTPPTAAADAAGAEPAGAGAGAADAQPTANGGAAAPASAPNAQKTDASSDSSRVPQLLADTWRLRDRLAAGAPELRNPLGDTPHLWRELTARLMQIERVYRTGGAPADELAPELERLVDAFGQLGERRPRVLQVATPLEERIAAAQPPVAISAARPTSLALAAALATRGGEPIPERIQKLAGPLDAFIGGSDAAEFRKWLGELPPDDLEFLELRLARQLVALPQLDPALFRLALQCRRRAEQTVAAALGRVAWVRPLVDAADAERLAGERALLDQIGSDRSARAESHLRSALRRYAETDAHPARLESAERLAQGLIDRLPHYVAWYQAAGGDRAAGAPRHRDLISLIDGLEELAGLLEMANPDHVNRAGTLAARLAGVQSQIESGLDAAALAALVDVRSRRGAAAQLAAILETPLVDVAARFRLLRAAPLVESEPAIAHADRNSRLGLPTAGAASDRQAWTRLAELEVRIATLSEMAEADASNTLAALTENLQELRVSAAGESAEPFWTSLHQIEQALSRFSADLPDRIQAVVEQNSDLSGVASREERRARLKVALRALRLVDARAAVRLDGVNPAHSLRPAEVYDLLVWQRARLLAARADTSADEFDFLTAAAGTCRGLAESVPGQPAVPLDMLTPPDLIGPGSIALASRPQQEVSLSLTHRGASSAPAWIVLDYDRALLDVVPETGADVYTADQLRALRRGYPPRPVEEHEPATWTLAPGAQASLQLTVKRREQAVGEARLIVKAIIGPAYIRRVVPVSLPASDGFELRFATPGVNGTWSRGTEAVRLHPFPNRTTPFQLLLSYVERDRSRGPGAGSGGSSPPERKANVSVLAPQQPLTTVLPGSPVPLAEAEALVRRLSGAVEVAREEGVVVQSGGEAVGLTLAAPPPAAAAAPPSAAAPAPAAGGGAAPAAGDSADQPLSLVHGLVVVIREPDAGVATLRHVEIAPQRPRRYVAVRVDYDREREQIVVSASPRGPSAIPAEGIQLRARLAEPVPTGAVRLATGELKPAGGPAVLRLPVPATGGRSVRLYVDVDGYPRAFVYRVPCAADLTDIPEESGLQEIRVLEPPPGQAGTADVTSILVRFEVDAPVGAFQNGGDVVEIGLDHNGDRRLDGEPALRFANDRQVAVSLETVTDDGLLAVSTQAGDFRVELPVNDVGDARLNVVSRLVAGRQSAWALPVPILIDGSPPEVERPERIVAVAGDQFTVSLLATDRGDSGVARVEVLLDTAETGQFTADPKPVVAQLTSDGRWTARLPTEGLGPGDYGLLVRATDAVGNVSPTIRSMVRVIGPEEAQSLRPTAAATVSGVVVFGNDPVPTATVELVPAEPPPAAAPAEEGEPAANGRPAPVKFDPVVTGQDGRFTFANVPAGKYKLTAKRVKPVLFNRPRVQTVEITVEPPARVPSQRIVLK